MRLLSKLNPKVGLDLYQKLWGVGITLFPENYDPGSMGQRYVCRREAYAKKNTLSAMKHGGGLVMLWGCAASSGTEGEEDGFKKYHEILGEEAESWVLLD